MRFRLIAATLSLAVAVAPLQAQVAPAGTFGSLPANSFGGTGIPTNAVMIGGLNGVSIGLSATQRYFSPAVTNDGAGTYFAGTGISTGAPVNAGFAAWNFDYFVGGATSGRDFFTLYVDANPAIGNTLAQLTPYSWSGNFHDSTNLHYFSASFDPNVAGEYSFALYQYDASGTVIDHVAMNVDVGITATPEPASLVLFGTGLLGIGGLVRRRRKA